MNITQRGTGNTNLLKMIQQESKKVSQTLGLSESMRIFPEQPKVDESQLGAAASLGLNRPKIPQGISEFFSDNSTTPTPVSLPSSGNVKFDFTKSSLDRLVSDVELLSSTKEYFNATQSLLSLYALGYLDDVVLDKLSREDLNEIRGIVREFKSILDNY